MKYSSTQFLELRLTDVNLLIGKFVSLKLNSLANNKEQVNNTKLQGVVQKVTLSAGGENLPVDLEIMREGTNELISINVFHIENLEIE